MAHTLMDTFEDRDADVRHNGAATASLVLGLLTLLLSVLAGIPAVIAGVVGLARARSRGTGAVRSAVGIVLGLGSVVVLVVAVNLLAPLWSTVQTVREYQSQGLPLSEAPEAQEAVAQAREALGQWGVEPSSVTCGSPSPSGTDIGIDCTGALLTGEPAVISGTCPAAALLGGEATCEATVNGEPHQVRVTLVDGVPAIEVL